MEKTSFGRYFSREFYQNLKRKTAEFFEDIFPLYSRNYLIRQMKKENLKKNDLEKSIS